MTQAVKELLEMGVVSPCTEEKSQLVSKIFLADKPNGKKRFILNLKDEFVVYPHFKMEDFRTALKLIYMGFWMATIDLKDAYFLISVSEPFRKFLRFNFDDNLYEFTCMPFGLS